MDSAATKIAIAAQKVQHLEEEVEELRKRVDELSAQRNNALIWGVITLGSAVVGLLIWIFNAGHGK